MDPIGPIASQGVLTRFSGEPTATYDFPGWVQTPCPILWIRPCLIIFSQALNEILRSLSSIILLTFLIFNHNIKSWVIRRMV